MAFLRSFRRGCLARRNIVPYALSIFANPQRAPSRHSSLLCYEAIRVPCEFIAMYHDQSHLSWEFVILSLAAVFKVATFVPGFLYTRRLHGVSRNAPALAIQELMIWKPVVLRHWEKENVSNVDLNEMLLLQIRHTIKQVQRVHGFRWWSLLPPAAIQAGVWIYVSLAIRSLCLYPTPEWQESLQTTFLLESSLTLPVFTSLLNLVCFHMAPRPPQDTMYRKLWPTIIIMNAGLAMIGCCLPMAITLFWFSSSLTTLVIYVLIRTNGMLSALRPQWQTTEENTSQLFNLFAFYDLGKPKPFSGRRMRHTTIDLPVRRVPM